MSSWISTEDRKRYCSPLDNAPDIHHRLKIETLLDSIETSVDPVSRKRLIATRKTAEATAERFRIAPGPHHPAKLQGKLESCSQQFALFATEDGYAVHPLRCRRRECPICQQARTQSWYHRFRHVSKHMSAPKHITLTLRSSDRPLGEQITHLIESFRRLRQQHLWKRRNAWGYWTIEITYNDKTHQYHPHIHVIACMPFLAQAALSEAWHQATGDSYVVRVKAVRGDLSKYLCKYVAKASTIFAVCDDPHAVAAALKGRRLVNQFGNWPDIPAQDAPICMYIGTVFHILRQAAKGRYHAKLQAAWLLRNATYAIQAALKYPPPRR